GDLDDLAVSEREGAVADSPVDAGVEVGVGRRPRRPAQLLDVDVGDAGLLGELPAGGVGPLLAGAQHAAEGDVPVAGVHLLPVGAAVHHQLAGGGDDGDVAGTVAGAAAPGPH